MYQWQDGQGAWHPATIPADAHQWGTMLNAMLREGAVVTVEYPGEGKIKWRLAR